MKTTVETTYNKSLHSKIGDKAPELMLPYIDQVFSKVECKTEEIVFGDELSRKELQISFETVKNVDEIFDLRLKIRIVFSNLGAGYLKPDERVLNMSTVVMPVFPFKTLQKVYQESNAFGGSENFWTNYNDDVKDRSYDVQMQKLINDYNGHFERAIEVYRKTINSLIEKGDIDILASLPDVVDLFIFTQGS